MEDYRDRNRLWQTQSLQEKLADARVVIGGMGGLGWQIGSALIGLGVGHIAVFDPDTLALVNFNRLWGCRRDQVDRAKVDIFTDIARGVDQAIDIKAHVQAIPCVDFENALGTADVVFGGYDLPEPRLATQILALKAGVLYIDTGAAIQASDDGFIGFGQVFVSHDTVSTCIVCCGLHLESIGYRGEGLGPLPSSGVLNGILANMAVSIWMQFLLGKPVPQVSVFDWNRLSIQPHHNIPQRPNCSICGADPAWAKPMATF